ncbi:NAD-dependent epimerase/dehydratase family protein [Paenibacillus sp. sptzw28]|nr:NAD-dependent epimerase/dehydratase family protein [Paenibacillus sp. sptzw28]
MDERSMSRPRLLITGAGGFCGEHACRYFADAGWDVTALVHRLPQQGEAEWLRCAQSVIRCDLIDLNETKEALVRVQPGYVLHLAGMNAVPPSWSDPADVLHSNVMGTVHLLEAVRRLGGGDGSGKDGIVKCRVVVAGSMLRFPLPPAGELPSPPHPYSLSKTMQVLAAQSWAALYGMDVVVAEPSNLIGPGRSSGICALIARYAAAAERAAAAGTTPPAPFRLSSRTENRDVLDVRDAVRAYDLLLRQGERGRIYPVASGTMRTLGELADTFDSLASCPLQWSVGESDSPSPAPVDCHAVRALGWSPRIPLMQSLQDALETARKP